MKWKKGESSVSLTQSDMKIVAQCKIPFTEIIQRNHPNKNIPPLWSVLSYVILQRNNTAEGVWFYYRLLRKMAENTSQCYYRRQIPKANDGFREIFVPSLLLQREQRYIMNTILSGLPIDDHAYAYRKGVSIEDCAKPHIKKDVLIHLDIKYFFGSITEDMVYEILLSETGYAKSLCRFLTQLCCLHRSLPQGTITSPTLSNIVFRQCDIALAELADKHHMDYTRYSDDLFFSGSQAVKVKDFLKEASGILLRFGFKLNTEKTKIRRHQHRQDVLGLTVNDHIQVNREYRRKLMQELYYLERFGQICNGATESGDYLKYMQKLQGKLAYVIHMDPDNSKLWEAHLKLTLRMNRYAFLRERGFVT